MSKPVKDLMTSEVRKRYEGIDSVCVIDISGLDAINTNLMRGELKKQNIRMQVVKNSVARRALSGSVLEPLAKSLAGPCALVYGEPAITDIAKELAKWAKAHKTITLKSGIMEGDPDLLDVAELSRMKGRTELVGEIGMLVSSPGSNLAAQLASPAGKIAGCLKAMIEKNEAA